MTCEEHYIDKESRLFD